MKVCTKYKTVFINEFMHACTYLFSLYVSMYCMYVCTYLCIHLQLLSSCDTQVCRLAVVKHQRLMSMKHLKFNAAHVVQTTFDNKGLSVSDSIAIMSVQRRPKTIFVQDSNNQLSLRLTHAVS